MRDHNKAFCSLVAETFDCPGPVFEFGSYQVDGQEGYANLAALFPGKEYVGCDMRPGPGVDRVEDVTAISLPDESAGTVLCIETFEHVFEVSKASTRSSACSSRAGIFVITSPLNFRIHGYPDDYWRMTPNCLRRHLSPYAARVVRLSGLSCVSAHGDGGRAQGAGRRRLRGAAARGSSRLSSLARARPRRVCRSARSCADGRR